MGTKEEAKMSKRTNDSPPSKRERERVAMLEEALRRPGVREVMEVFGAWQRADRGLDPYRSATKEASIVTTTDHANV